MAAAAAEADQLAVITRAATRFGSLDAPDESEERYVLEGVVLPARQSPADEG